MQLHFKRNVLVRALVFCAAIGTGALAGAPAQAKVDGDKIILGLATSFTGKYAEEGKNQRDGTDLAVKTINAKGGVKVGGKTYKLEIKYYDDESTPARTAQLLERLINQDGIKYVLGPYSSGTTKAAVAITEKHKILMVQGSGASRSLFTQGYRYMFATLSTSEQYLSSSVDLAAEVAQKNGKKPGDVRVAMAFENDPFSLDVRAGVVDEMKKYGMKAVIDDKLPRDLSDMSATMTKVKALKPDLLLVSGHAKGATTAARQLNEMNVMVPMIAITQCESADFVGKFGKGAEHILCPAQWAETLTYRDSVFGSASDYAKLFLKTYPEYKTVPYQTAQGASPILVWADVFTRAQSFDTEKLRDAIAATDLETFFGHIKFGPAGRTIAKPMVLRQIQNGEYNVVAPTKWASHKLIYPRKVGGK